MLGRVGVTLIERKLLSRLKFRLTSEGQLLRVKRPTEWHISRLSFHLFGLGLVLHF